MPYRNNDVFVVYSDHDFLNLDQRSELKFQGKRRVILRQLVAPTFMRFYQNKFE